MSRRSRPGLPGKDREIREPIRRIANANILWGSPRVHGELLKLGIDISERTVSRWMPRWRRKPPSQTWRTFLDKHIGELVSIDFLTVPTATFRVLFVRMPAPSQKQTYCGSRWKSCCRTVGRDWKGKISPVLYLVAIVATLRSMRIAQGILVSVALIWLVPDRRIKRVLRHDPV